MEIMQVVSDLVCSKRVVGFNNASLRVLKDLKGKQLVATDPVGVSPGEWVFTASGSAARIAMKDMKMITDLTICGIIDDWYE
ncbi:carboxysome peptide B [Thiomicrorhabdus aquaedulcis]|uniref:carboxysome peptide B n=1 Tax=Thiomicrorhabdus aquaedulcis TaxID=2211106 RepID=UPI000FDBA4F5|nr:carboxysome peptide B [Thiomicrorhabdus aquaedulcis]